MREDFIIENSQITEETVDFAVQSFAEIFQELNAISEEIEQCRRLAES